MRPDASRMSTPSPITSMRASRRVGIGSSTRYRKTATAARMAVHVNMNGVGSTPPVASFVVRKTTFPSQGSKVAVTITMARAR